MISRILQIQEYYKNKGVSTIKSFCDKFGFDNTNWSKYVKGIQNISLTEDVIQKLQTEGISVEWVRTGKGDMFSVPTQSIVVLPVYNIRATCGLGGANCDEIFELIENVSFDSKLFPASFKSELEKCKIVIASGRSMENEIFDGDYVLYQPQDFWSKEGIYIINVGGDLMIKTVLYDKVKCQLTLISKNAIYPAQTYSGQELDKVRMVGKVVAVLHKYDCKTM